MKQQTASSLGRYIITTITEYRIMRIIRGSKYLFDILLETDFK